MSSNSGLNIRNMEILGESSSSVLADDSVRNDPDPNVNNHASASHTTDQTTVYTSSSSIRRPLTSDELDDGYRQVTTKKNRKQTSPIHRHAPITTDDSSLPNASDSLNNHDTCDEAQAVAGDGQHGAPRQPAITNESTRYAITRYPFPPFTVCFKAGKISAHQIESGLIAHCKSTSGIDLQIITCRQSNQSSIDNKTSFQIYVNDAVSFSFLLDQTRWPGELHREKYVFASSPSIPPQLCLLIKNVDLRIDFDDFCADVKTNHPQVRNVIRMRNKFQNEIKLVKLEFTSSSKRNDILEQEKIVVNYISYEVTEYLAPASVLICSKCMALGHFKRQCTQIKETCRVCGDQVDDLKKHNCSRIEKCVHCNQNHKSSSLKCPVVKSFRAELTRKLLRPVNDSSSMITSNPGRTHIPPHFPPFSWGNPSSDSENSLVTKLDRLLQKVEVMDDHILKLNSKHDKFEQYMLTKNQHDDVVTASLTNLSVDVTNVTKDVALHSVLLKRHENLLVKLFIPTIEEILSVFSAQNRDKKGHFIDADLHCRLDRYLVQLKKATEGNQFA